MLYYGMALRISITSDYKQYQRKLQRIAGAFAETMAKTINITAHAVDNKSHRNLRTSMILRNQYTERSLRVSDARVKKSGGTGYAEVGSISPYLPLQEKGGIRRPKRGSRVPVPSRAARGGNWRRPILPRYRLKPGVSVSHPGRRTKGSKFFILRPGRNPERGNVRHTMAKYRKTGKGPRYGAYRLMAPAIFTRTGRKKLIKIRYLNEPYYRIHALKWHSRAVKQFGQERVMRQVFIREAKKRLGLIR